MNAQPRILYRSRSNRMVGGVCGGLAEYFNIDPTVIRLLFVFGVIFGFGSLLLVYLVMLVVIPENSMNPAVSPSDMPQPPETPQP